MMCVWLVLGGILGASCASRFFPTRRTMGLLDLKNLGLQYARPHWPFHSTGRPKRES